MFLHCFRSSSTARAAPRSPSQTLLHTKTASSASSARTTRAHRSSTTSSSRTSPTATRSLLLLPPLLRLPPSRSEKTHTHRHICKCICTRVRAQQRSSSPNSNSSTTPKPETKAEKSGGKAASSLRVSATFCGGAQSVRGHRSKKTHHAALAPAVKHVLVKIILVSDFV